VLDLGFALEVEQGHGLLHFALAAVITILLCCAFWILTAWPAGAAAPMMAGVLCCFFATQDDPAPAILAPATPVQSLPAQ